MDPITPRIDLAFKKIFGVEENKDLLISLINSIVSEEDQVADVEIVNPYNLQSFKHDKLSILDVKAKGMGGKMYNIEIQVTNDGDYDKRALYYWARLYSQQIGEGGNYADLSKAIGIHILNFFSVPDSPKYHNVFHITEKDTNIKYFTDLELHTIELDKFTKSTESPELSSQLQKIKTSLDAWTTFLTRHNLFDKDSVPKELQIIPMQKALRVVEYMNFTKEERQAYEERFKWLWIEHNTLKKMREEGKAEGKAERNIEIAKNLLKQNIDINIISMATGLSVEEISQLKMNELSTFC